MRNDNLNAKKLIDLISSLPYFKMTDLLPFKDRYYLKIIVSRYSKRGEIIRLKKGLYVSKKYLDSLKRKGDVFAYNEFIANSLCKSSYLSLEYVLSEHNIIAEQPKNFTSISLIKNTSFSNAFGKFFYHKIKKDLFLGFDVIKKDDFIILKATKVKALFDFIYLRKNILINKESVYELRINIENISLKDWKELEKYVKLEGSKKIREVFNILKEWKH
jgi:predicted transcriptional regulator of viral defense system